VCDRSRCTNWCDRSRCTDSGACIIVEEARDILRSCATTELLLYCFTSGEVSRRSDTIGGCSSCRYQQLCTDIGYCACYGRHRSKANNGTTLAVGPKYSVHLWRHWFLARPGGSGQMRVQRLQCLFTAAVFCCPSSERCMGHGNLAGVNTGL
jgi:hypothetical protein